MTRRAKALALCASQALMLGCLSLLQVAPGRFSLALLVAMHVGIVSFMKLRRSLAAGSPDVARVARATYLLLAVYLPVLLYRLLGTLGLLRVDPHVLLGVTVGLSLPAALLNGWAIWRLGVRGGD
ncbi:MAG: hypothetical protein AB1778_01780 [Candidatus Bipolaricaulota bacterium]